MDCPHRILPSGTHACHHRSQSQHRHPNSTTSHLHHNNRYRCSRSRSQSHPCRYHSCSHHDSHRGCSRSYNRDSSQQTTSQEYFMMPTLKCLFLPFLQRHPNRRSSSCRSSLAHAQDHSKSCSWSTYRPAKKTLHQNSLHSGISHGNMCTKGNSRVTIDDPQTDFYSSDVNFSGSEEDSDHLN